MTTESGLLPEGETGAALVVDGDRIVEASDSCAVVFRRPVEEILGRRLSDLESSSVFEAGFVEDFERARSSDDGRTFRTGIRSAPGEEPHVYEVRIDEVTDDGTVCSFHDVGTQYRYEETVNSLHGVTRKLMAADSEREVLERTGDAANEVLGFPGVGVREYDPDTETLEHFSFGGVVNEIDTRPGFDVDDSPHGRAFRTGETVVEEIPEEDDPFDRSEFSHTMYVPIGDYGVLSLGRVGGPFDRADVRFAEILAENARTALEQVRRKRRLREQRRRLEDRNERLDEFASAVSHDLRGPLSISKAALDSFLRSGDEAFVEDARDALDRMDDIIDEILDLAREGVSPDDLEPVSLPATARAAWRNVETGDVELVVGTRRTVRADPDRIQRLFENLFRNSVEHGSTGSRAEADHSSENGPGSDPPGEGTVTTVVVDDFELGFFVADDGVGIDPEERDAVFESGYTTTEDGTGFGLAIVDRIASAHDFSVQVTDSEYGGARIEVVGQSMFEG